MEGINEPWAWQGGRVTWALQNVMSLQESMLKDVRLPIVLKG